MIYDKINNSETYLGLSQDIRMGLEFLRNITLDVEKGVYEITPHVKAIISEYTTKEVNENGYEAHRDYIDIQYLVTGTERICSLPLEYLEETKPYNKGIDAAFYEATNVKPQEVLIGNGFFAIFYPQDGHMPQLSVHGTERVKKVVIKVKIV